MKPIKLWQKMRDWEHFDDSECVHIFLYLLLEAKQNQTTFKGNKVKRGQLVAGKGKISLATNIEPENVKRCMRKMRDSDNLKFEVLECDGTKYSLITIIGYSEYQKDSEPVGPTRAQKQAETKSTNKAIASQFVKPTIDDVKEHIKKRVAKGRPKVDADQFWSFYESKGWRVGNQPMKSWEAAIITWEVREIEKGNTGILPASAKQSQYSDKDRMHDWINADPGFKQRHGMHLHDFRDIVARELVDLDEKQFRVKFGVAKSTAREIKECY